MTSNNRHIIKSQQFIVEIENVNKADEFFRKVKHLQYDRIEDQINKVLNKYSEDGVSLIFDQIELDLGIVSDLKFEQEVTWKIEEALIEFFRNNISVNGKLKSGKRITDEKIYLEQISVYLTTGNFNWNKKDDLSHKAILKELIANQKGGDSNPYFKNWNERGCQKEND